MGKLGNHTRLALEALLQIRIRRKVRGQHFDRDRSVETWIVSAIDLPHPASSEGAHDLVWPQFRSQGKAHQLLTLVPAFYVLKEQRGKTALVRAPPRGVLMVVQKGSRQHALKTFGPHSSVSHDLPDY